MGRKPTINRCLLYPMSPYANECDKFLILGCHFGRSEAPFYYDTTKNNYVKFQQKDVFMDMYRSNDVVQFEKNSVYLRPFIKVGEPCESVKVFKYFIEKSTETVNPVSGQQITEEQNGPDSQNKEQSKNSAPNQRKHKASLGATKIKSKNQKSMSILSNYIDRHSKSQNKASDQKHSSYTNSKSAFEINKAYSCAKMFNPREKVDANLKRLQTFQANSLRFDHKTQYENAGLNDHSNCDDG